MHLFEVSADNWQRCVNLKVQATQTNLICTSAEALAEAANAPSFFAFELRNGTETVGLLVLVEDSTSYEIHRFMIDERHQGRGYATAALRALLRRWGDNDARPDVIVKFLHWNEWAETIYKRVGFCDTGIRDGDEKVFKLDWMRYDQYVRAHNE